MRVLALTHGALVGPELFGEVIREQGHELVEWDIPRQGRPADDGFDAVIVLGGNMNVGEELEHTWLQDEYELLRSWVETETPLLGICLGAQTLAHALGAEVARLSEPQIGFREVVLTAAGEGDAVVGALPRRFAALFGNGYSFVVPDGGVDLVDGEGRSQGFRFGDRAWAVQFHPEARREQVLAWWRHETLPRPLPELADELDAGIGRWHELGRSLCLAFLSAALRRPRQAPNSAGL
jgi:GMP synthase (glutamine-hydrolysing)